MSFQKQKVRSNVFLFLLVGFLFSTPLTTRATLVDSDQDGLSDSAEIELYHTDPHKTDTDGDSVPDGQEITESTNPIDGQDSTPRVFEEQEITLREKSLYSFVPFAISALVLLTILIIRATFPKAPATPTM
jgi:hypothetical protein